MRLNSINQRNFGVDAARCVAITGVILIHSQILGYGHFGVQLFFMISGYLLANLKKENAIMFITHRFFRLFPLYIVFFIISFNNSFGSLKESIPSLFMLQNLWYSFESFPGGWSISSEWIFSLVLILFVTLSKKRFNQILIIFSIISLLLAILVFLRGGVDNLSVDNNYAAHRWLNTWNPISNMNFFLIGIGIRKNFIYIIKSKIILWTLFIGSVVFDIFIGNLLVLQQLGIYSIFLICLHVEASKYNFLIKLVSFIGKRTYGIFFSHFYVYGMLDGLMHHLDGLGSNYIKFFEFFLVIVISTGIGAVTWKYVELPGIKFGQKFHKKF